jgi:hypothetical protein
MARECVDCEYATDVELELWEHWNEVHEPMSRDAFICVLNYAADRVIEEVRRGDLRERDAIKLVVRVLGAMLDNPDASVEQVMGS